MKRRLCLRANRINSLVYSVTRRPNVGHTVIQFSLSRPPAPASRSTPPSFFLFALFTLSAPLISALVHLLLARAHTHTIFRSISRVRSCRLRTMLPRTPAAAVLAR